MSRTTVLAILGYGLLTGLLLACLWLLSFASIRLPWGRELAGGVIAVLAMVVGMRLTARTPHQLPAPPEPQTPSATAALAADGGETVSAPSAVSEVGLDPGLSPRERQVLSLLAEGQSNKQIARSLSLSENTIKTHLANVYAKLGAGGRTEALAIARRRGLFADG
jgi:DNA-binding CsgD family transcriptional regulator